MTEEKNHEKSGSLLKTKINAKEQIVNQAKIINQLKELKKLFKN
jgi:hypothetical protein